MLYRLKTKLSLTYTIIAFVIVGFITILSKNLVDKHFISYVEENNVKNIDNIIHNIEHQYHDTLKWDRIKINNLSSQALKEGIVIDIKDLSGKIIWNTSEELKKTEEELLSPVKNGMLSRYWWWKGSITERIYPIHLQNAQIGEVVVKFYEPFYFTGHDLDFINMLYKILFIAMLISIILAISLGIWISRQISIPISNTIELTKDISRGNYSKRIETKTNTYETNELASAVNLLAEKLEEQDVIRKRIVTDVSHELRTPLTVIQNYLEALIDGIWEPTSEKLSNIYQEIVRVNRMVGDLSMLTKYESGIQKINKTVFDLDNLIERIVSDFEVETLKKEIQVNIYNGVRSVYADEDKISQLIVNILSNSIKYTDNNGEIYIETLKENSNVIIKIRDTGIGIPRGDLNNIFERFYRVDRSRSRATGGAGVGLTIVKTIVDAHRGKINVKSEVGVGTEFIVTLPQ